MLRSKTVKQVLINYHYDSWDNFAMKSHKALKLHPHGFQHVVTPNPGCTASFGNKNLNYVLAPTLKSVTVFGEISLVQAGSCQVYTSAIILLTRTSHARVHYYINERAHMPTSLRENDFHQQ